MDIDYINRLQKSLEELFESKFEEILNKKDYGDFREVQGYIKAIRVFGDLIKEANNPVKRNKDNG